MNTIEFQNNLDRWGSDPSDWPAAENKRASALLHTSEVARASLDRAQALNRVLAGSSANHKAPHALTRRILNDSRLGAHPQVVDDPFDVFINWLRSAVWRGALLAALPLIVGFSIGLTSAAAEDTLAEDLSALALISAYQEIDYAAE